MNTKQFKVGDRVAFVANYADVLAGDQGVVRSIDCWTGDAGETQLVYVTLDKGTYIGGVFERRLKLSAKFRVGDKVKLIDETKYSGQWAGVMTVDTLYSIGDVIGAVHPVQGGGAFLTHELEVANEEPKFKVGDKVRVVNPAYTWAHGKDAVVTEAPYSNPHGTQWSQPGICIEVNLAGSEGRLFMDGDLEIVAQEPRMFQVGDRVEFTENYGMRQIGERGTVKGVEKAISPNSQDAKQLIELEMDEASASGTCSACCYDTRLKLVEEFEPEQYVEEAVPVAYRIAVNGNIGTTEYPSVEAAEEAAKEFGDDADEFAIYEVTKIADYRVKVTKSVELEAI